MNSQSTILNHKKIVFCCSPNKYLSVILDGHYSAHGTALDSVLTNTLLKLSKSTLTNLFIADLNQSNSNAFGTK